MKTTIFSLILVLSLTASVSASRFDPNTLTASTEGPVMPAGGGLLDPNRFSISHSYSMSYSSGTSQSSWDGLYLSSMQYQFSVPVTLFLDMGLSHQPGALFNKGPVDNSMASESFVIPRVGLQYKPTKNTTIRLQYFNMKGTSPRALFNGMNSENPLFTPNGGF